MRPDRNTDGGNARRLVERHGNDIHYCYPWKKWLVWDGQRWAVDQSGAIERHAKDTIDAMFKEAVALEGDERKELIEHALQTEGRAARIRDMIGLAQSEKGVAVQPDDLDANHWLLNCRNGTVDLRTGRLRKHARKDMLTSMCPVEFDPRAETKHWLAFLDRIFASNAEMIAFIRRLLGYCLTGDVREDALPIFYGTGANGKSTLSNVVLELMGTDYATEAAPDLLLAKGNEHPTERAQLFRRRVVFTNETDKGRRLAESFVKAITGRDPINCRRLYENHWRFWPTHKIILATNHRPEVRGTDHGIWRRLKLIPFGVVIPDHEQDKTLPDKLRGEFPGILAWMVKGCLEWQANGLQYPDEVTAATAEYRAREDVLARFLSDRCITGPGMRSKASQLMTAYVEWCGQTGERPVKQKEFGERMTERGFQRLKSVGVKVYDGIGIRDEGTVGTTF
jgi:putative DNA primase/helicase